MLIVQLPIFALLYGVIQSYQELFSVSGGFLIWRDLSAGGWGSKLVVLGYHDTNLILSCVDYEPRLKNSMATDNNGFHIPVLLHHFTKRYIPLLDDELNNSTCNHLLHVQTLQD